MRIFWEIYNTFPENKFIISARFFNRIKDKHYSFIGLDKIIFAMRWFMNTYNLDEYCATFKYNGNSVPYINVYRGIYDINIKNDKVVEYKIMKDNLVLITSNYEY